MNPFRKAIGRGFRAIAPGGGGSNVRRHRSSEQVNINVEAGARIDSSVVYPAIRFGVRALGEASLKVYRESADGTFVEIPNHPVTELLKQPVPWYGGDLLLSASVVALMLQGNAYLYKHRGGGRKIRGLEYLPLNTCYPESKTSQMFIDCYRVAVPGGAFQIPVEDMVHLRWDTVDPFRPALGYSPLESCLPEIAADKRAGRYEAAMLRNWGKAHLLAPSGKDEMGQPLTFGAAQREEFAKMMTEETTGDSAGSTVVMPFPVDSVQIGFSPADLALEHTHNLCEERISACFGIPAVVLGFGAGLEESNNRASASVADIQALKNFTLPTMRFVENQLTRALIPELGAPGEVIRFDRNEIPAYVAWMALQDAEDTNSTPNEKRSRKGLPPIEGGDALPTTKIQENDRPKDTPKEPKK